ncbi:MAG: CpaF family protein [Symbiobacteriia bacterium]
MAEQKWQGPAPADTIPDDVLHLVQRTILTQYGALLPGARSEQERRRQLRTAVLTILVGQRLAPRQSSREAWADQLVSEIAGYGPLDPLLDDPSVSEIMVNGWDHVYIEREGVLQHTERRFRDNRHVEEIIGRMVAPLGRRLDQSSPYVDARLPDGSRVNAVIPPVAVRGPALTIRKFRAIPLVEGDLVKMGSASPALLRFLRLAILARLNLLVSGGTGTGKTTLLNLLSSYIPGGRERLVTIEDAVELQLQQENLVALETRPPNMEGRGEVTMRQLVRNALRMRPDRIIVGEVRGGEALDMVQAMNTGHEGSLSTVHANSPLDALRRLENMVLLAGVEVPHSLVREQVQSAIDLVVHLAREADGVRRVVEVAAMNKSWSADGDPATRLQPLFHWTPQQGHAAVGRRPFPAGLVARLERAGVRGEAEQCLLVG